MDVVIARDVGILGDVDGKARVMHGWGFRHREACIKHVGDCFPRFTQGPETRHLFRCNHAGVHLLHPN